MKKPTLATLKSFIRKNKDDLFVEKTSDFDGMVDCVMPTDGGFTQVDPSTINFNDNPNTLGIRGVWLVNSSRDYITTFDDGCYAGFAVSNCCGSFKVVTPVK